MLVLGKLTPFRIYMYIIDCSIINWDGKLYMKVFSWEFLEFKPVNVINVKICVFFWGVMELQMDLLIYPNLNKT